MFTAQRLAPEVSRINLTVLEDGRVDITSTDIHEDDGEVAAAELIVQLAAAEESNIVRVAWRIFRMAVREGFGRWIMGISAPYNDYGADDYDDGLGKVIEIQRIGR